MPNAPAKNEHNENHLDTIASESNLTETFPPIGFGFPPKWFWFISMVALIWNLLGLTMFLVQAVMGDAFYAEQPEAVQELYKQTPVWVTAAFAIAVFAGVGGCILLLMRNKLALIAFMLSLAAVTVQHIYSFFLSNTVEVLGLAQISPAFLVILIGVGLILFTQHSLANKWIT